MCSVAEISGLFCEESCVLSDKKCSGNYTTVKVFYATEPCTSERLKGNILGLGFWTMLHGAQGLLLAGLGGPYAVPGTRIAIYAGKSLNPCTIFLGQK